MMNHPTVLSLSRYEFAAQSAQELKPALPSPVVYDVGAGQGQMRTPIQALELDWQGFDAFPASDSVKRWDLDDQCPAKNPEAGLVLLLEVIEHLRNPGISLRHVAAALLPGGRLLVTTPNPRWSCDRAQSRVSRCPC
jgi:2-polyprenyl-3-methyl-5-hydroxy-6-metoxy-1,4-benzoquinol methylase